MSNPVQPKPFHPKLYKAAECIIPVLGLIPICKKIDELFHSLLTVSKRLATIQEKGGDISAISAKFLQKMHKTLAGEKLCMKLAVYRNLPVTLLTLTLSTLLILGKIGVAAAFIGANAAPLGIIVIIAIGLYALMGVFLERESVYDFEKDHLNIEPEKSDLTSNQNQGADDPESSFFSIPKLEGSL